MQISATMVRDLRDKTGAGIMECKAALAEAGGDLAKAVEVLRKRGLKTAEKKAGRIAADGLVVTWISPGRTWNSPGSRLNTTMGSPTTAATPAITAAPMAVTL